MSVLVVRLKEGPCPPEAHCLSVGRILSIPAQIPPGDYLVVMSAAVAQAVDLESIRGNYRCVICVGPATAAAVGRCVVPRQYSSYGVAALLRAMEPGRTVVLRSAHGNDVLRRELPDVVEVAVYRVEVDPQRLAEAARAAVEARAVVVTSAMAAEVLASAADLRGKRVVAIGPVTSARLRELGIPHVVAPKATIESAVRAAL